MVMLSTRDVFNGTVTTIQHIGDTTAVVECIPHGLYGFLLSELIPIPKKATEAQVKALQSIIRK